MDKIFDTYIPEGFSTVSTYLFTEKPLELIDFLKKAFYAIEIGRTINPTDDAIANCILKIGNTKLMLSQANGQFVGMNTCFYFYVSDVDEMYQRALAAGGEAVFPPANMDYGDRQGGVKDPFGNYWWISTRLEKKGYHE